VGGTSKGKAYYVHHEGGVLYYAQDDGTTALTSGEVLTFSPSGATVTTSGTPSTPTPERIFETQAFGITRRSQALRLARHHLNRALLTPRFATLKTWLGDLHIEPGDVVTVSEDHHSYAAKLWTVLNVSIEEEGTGAVELREYHAGVYADNVDAVPSIAVFLEPGGAVDEGLRAPSDSTSDKDGESVTSPPPATSPTPSPPPSSSAGSGKVTTTPAPTPTPTKWGGSTKSTSTPPKTSTKNKWSSIVSNIGWGRSKK
jgi:hypothetical protein